ncbi:hypothetical protein F5X68DRAFT_254047 [Plectosphaerella plurivora]|uniref:SnoaL-like domain-containing protein n=1 Tax=Plectosphaerella plurivora TaxID=936078 RepID=A0A9P8VGP9_9PEZI|nr:hypothetical protein F5X68DRAFT_254047 [Plectosphaerella plurivora]
MASVPTTREEARAWLAKLHGIHDSLEAQQIDSMYAQDATLQFGNAPLVKGLDAIKAHFGGSYVVTASMEHQLKEYEIVGNRIWHTVEITIRVKGDATNEDIMFRAAAFSTILTEGPDAGKMDRYEIYADHSDLAKKFAAVFADAKE